jgi:hypothetical protein
MNNPAEMITIPAGEVLRGVSAQTLARALLDKIQSELHSVTLTTTTGRNAPRIGAEWLAQGGIYAGPLCLGCDRNA